MLFALLVTACSDSENEDPNGGGGGTNKGSIIGLNIKDAKLIYGVEKASAKSMLKSSGSSNYFRQVTRGNQNMEVTWVTENGDTTSITAIYAIANLNDDHLIVGTGQYLGDDSGLSLETGRSYMGYIINKNTGKVINADNPIISSYEGTGGDIDWDDFTSFYNYDKHCYLKGRECVIKVNIETSELTKMFEGADDIKILPNGAFFVHMTDGKHKYGSLLDFKIEELSENERYNSFDHYIPVNSIHDEIIYIVAIKDNLNETSTCTIIEFYCTPPTTGYGFSDFFGYEKYTLTTDFRLPEKYRLGYNIVATSIKSSPSQVLISISNPYEDYKYNNIILRQEQMPYPNEGLQRLPSELIEGFVTRDYEGRHKPVKAKIARNSKTAFNMNYQHGLVITDFETLSQKTIKEIKGYTIKGVMGNYTDDKPITFIGDNWEKKKQCVGTIDSEGNAIILQEFNSEDNESMNGFLMELK